MVKVQHLYPVCVCGKAEEVNLYVVGLKNSAQKYGGTVKREEGDDTEVSLLFAFSDPHLMQVWANSIRTL